DKPVNTSEWRALLGVSGVGSSVQGAEGFTLEFQEKMTDSLYKDLSSDKNMSWVRRDSWLTYLTLNAPDDKVTYDMSVTPMGIVKVAPFGTEPMAIVDGASTANRPLDAPTAPMGTAMTLLMPGNMREPGATLLTRILSAASSRDNAFDRLISAALAML